MAGVLEVQQGFSAAIADIAALPPTAFADLPELLHLFLGGPGGGDTRCNPAFVGSIAAIFRRATAPQARAQAKFGLHARGAAERPAWPSQIDSSAALRDAGHAALGLRPGVRAAAVSRVEKVVLSEPEEGGGEDAPAGTGCSCSCVLM